jgi:hypothetical protein
MSFKVIVNGRSTAVEAPVSMPLLRVKWDEGPSDAEQRRFCTPRPGAVKTAAGAVAA